MKQGYEIRLPAARPNLQEMGGKRRVLILFIMSNSCGTMKKKSWVWWYTILAVTRIAVERDEPQKRGDRSNDIHCARRHWGQYNGEEAVSILA